MPRMDDSMLVTVFDCELESEAIVVQGLLESYGIDCILCPIDNAQDLMPFGGVTLKVRTEDVAQSKEVVEEYQTSLEDDPDPYGDYSSFSEGASF